MLRSLVGSEMCIRDRYSVEFRKDAVRLASARGTRRLTDVAAELGVAPSICLLYTSDAADDLLCVDLGGRRIIKKKKQITTHHYT